MLLLYYHNLINFIGFSQFRADYVQKTSICLDGKKAPSTESAFKTLPKLNSKCRNLLVPHSAVQA